MTETWAIAHAPIRHAKKCQQANCSPVSPINFDRMRLPCVPGPEDFQPFPPSSLCQLSGWHSEQGMWETATSRRSDERGIKYVPGCVPPNPDSNDAPEVASACHFCR